MKTKFKIFLLFGILICHSIGFSQIHKIVKLKNGSELRGKILPTSDNSIKLKTKDRNIWVFQHNEIDTIFTYKTPFIQSHFYNRTTIGILLGNPEGFSAQTVNGYSFKNGLDMGIGLGTESYQYPYNYRSIFGDIQYNFFKTRSTPFFNLEGGFLTPIRSSRIHSYDLSKVKLDKGGFMLGIYLGFNHYFSQHIGVTASMGYRFSQLTSRFNDKHYDGGFGIYNGMINDNFSTHLYHQFEIRFGLIFK